jgi:integrase
VSIRKRKDRGRVSWILDLVHPSTGKRHRFDTETKRAAEKLRDQKKAEWQKQEKLVGDPDTTLGKYATLWLALLPAMGLKPKTIRSYQGLYTKHIKPTLGSIKVRELRRADVRALLATKSEEIFKSTKTVQEELNGNATEIVIDHRLSRNTVRLIRATLSGILAAALDDDLIGENVALLSRRRGSKGAGSVNAAERLKAIRPFAEDELEKIIGSAAQHEKEYFAAVLFLARTGARPGEALALRWSDIDFANRKCLIERAVSSGKVTTTKTGTVRTIDLTRDLTDTLRALHVTRERQTLERQWGEVPEWVFVTKAEGKPMDYSKLRKSFARAMRRAEVSGHTLYALRHSVASHLLMKGAPITYVAAQLGHSKPSTTLAWYGRWLPQSGNGFIDRLEPRERVAS